MDHIEASFCAPAGASPDIPMVADAIASSRSPQDESNRESVALALEQRRCLSLLLSERGNCEVGIVEADLDISAWARAGNSLAASASELQGGRPALRFQNRRGQTAELTATS